MLLMLRLPALSPICRVAFPLPVTPVVRELVLKRMSKIALVRKAKVDRCIVTGLVGDNALTHRSRTCPSSSWGSLTLLSAPSGCTAVTCI